MSVSVGVVAQAIEKIAPKNWAEEWDNVGLIVGNYSDPVHKILLCLDGSMDSVKEAQKEGAQMIVAHHPIMFRPLKNLNGDNQQAKIPLELVKKNIAYYAAHTNLDQSRCSSSWNIGESLGLENMEYLRVTEHEKLVKLVAYVPEEYVEKIRQALVKVGVGEGITSGFEVPKYDECFYVSKGIGSFCSLEGANPAIGSVGERTEVQEMRIESLLPEKLMERAVRALIKAHPYEEPAYDLIPVHNKGKGRGYGAIGVTKQEKSLEDLSIEVKKVLKNLGPIEVKEEPLIRVAGPLDRPIRKIAIANGSGGSFLSKAIAKGVDVLITGDLSHHEVMDALEANLCIIDMGHFWGEVAMVESLASLLRGDKSLAHVELVISQQMSGIWNKDIRF